MILVLGQRLYTAGMGGNFAEHNLIEYSSILLLFQCLPYTEMINGL